MIGTETEINLDVELSFYTLNYGGSSAVLWSFHSGDIGSFPAGRISYDLETSDNKLPVTAPEGEMLTRLLFLLNRGSRIQRLWQPRGSPQRKILSPPGAGYCSHLARSGDRHRGWDRDGGGG